MEGILQACLHARGCILWSKVIEALYAFRVLLNIVSFLSQYASHYTGYNANAN